MARTASSTRRTFLKSLGVLGITAPFLPITGCGGGDDGKTDAFKLSARGQRSCKACRTHARNKVFLSAAIADSHRAHPGCNCKIKVVRMPVADAQRYFADFPYYDRRSAV